MRHAWYKVLLFSLLLLGAGIAVFWYYLLPPVYSLRNSPVRVTRWDRSLGEHQVTLAPGQADWLPLERVSRYSIQAILTAEDAKFYEHSGIDIQEIWVSMRRNWREGRYVRGASTITQQVVKLLYLHNDKTILRKLREISGALLLEQLLSKDEILAWYVNIVDFGSGIYGISAASHYYFSTPPELLTLQQSILLASVLPSPNRRSRSLRQKNLSRQGHLRFQHILERMRREGYIDSRQCLNALLTGNFGSPIITPSFSSHDDKDAHTLRREFCR